MGTPISDMVKQAAELKKKKKTDSGQPPDDVVINPDQKKPVNNLSEVQQAPLKTAVFAFGRFNPPTTGHEKLIDKVHEVANKHKTVGRVYASHSELQAKNPLSQQDKIKYLNKAFGHKVDIHGSSKAMPSFIHVAKDLSMKAVETARELHKQGHDHLVMVAGSDRVEEYKKKLNQYNGKDYHYKKIDVISSGQRDPDAEGAEGMSASKMRAHAHAGEFDHFKKGLPKALHPHSQEIYDKVRAIKEEQDVVENFADGRNPQDKGDSARHGIKKGTTIAQLKKIRSSKTASARKKQLAHWQINMRQGRNKMDEERKGLYYYVNKRKKAGTSRSKDHPDAPSAQDWEDAAKTAKEEFNLQEAAVTLAARVKRAQNMRKYRSRLQRGKKLAAAKLASADKLRGKTQYLARRVMKKQSAGKKGWEYQKLSPADKVAIDKMIDRKLAAVKRIAARLAPRVRQAEVKRMAARVSGRGKKGTLAYVAKPR